MSGSRDDVANRKRCAKFVGEVLKLSTETFERDDGREEVI